MSTLDQSLGFKFKYRLCGAPPTIQDILVADTSFVKGDLVNLESGELDLAATNDTALVGAIQETQSGMTASTSKSEVITDWDAVYEVYDANARAIGANLDISGTTGAMTVTSSTNADLTVVATSTATEPTLVMITHGEHWQQP